MNVYESERLIDMPDGLLRPGGFELTERLVSLARLSPGARILDVGCGIGSASDYLAGLGFEAVGVDISDVLTGRGRKLYPHIHIVTADAEKDLPFDDNSFDAVLFECSLSLMDAPAALKEAQRVMKQDGKLLISDVFDKEGRLMCLTSGKKHKPFPFGFLHFEDRTDVFESFVAELIMNTGGVDALFDCTQWEKIKKEKPRYCLAVGTAVMQNAELIRNSECGIRERG